MGAPPKGRTSKGGTVKDYSTWDELKSRAVVMALGGGFLVMAVLEAIFQW